MTNHEVPSREAVEKIAKHLRSAFGVDMFIVTQAERAHLAQVLDALLAEVERLTNELAFERRDRTMADAAAESLRATVAEQGAALAEIRRIVNFKSGTTATLYGLG
jgi:hypothetical protein